MSITFTDKQFVEKNLPHLLFTHIAQIVNQYHSIAHWKCCFHTGMAWPWPGLNNKTEGLHPMSLKCLNLPSKKFHYNTKIFYYIKNNSVI